MPNRSYRIGYNFERRVKKHFENLGYMVIRQGKSRFPDLLVIERGTTKIFFVECKVRGCLDVEENAKALDIVLDKIPFKVAYRRGKKLLIKNFEVVN